MSRVVLINEDGSQLWDDGCEIPWQGVLNTAAKLAARYDGSALEIRYANNRHAPLTVPSGLSDCQLSKWFGFWASEVQHGLGEVI